MADEELLKLVATTALKTLVASRKVKTPITSMDLLASVMTTKLPQGLLPHAKTPKFRLTDLARFEAIVEDLSNSWADGAITFSRDNSTKTMMIWELSVSQPGGPTGQPLLGSSHPPGGVGDISGFLSRKRKRIIDEDADSAAGDNESLLEEDVPAASSSTMSLSYGY